MDNHVKTIMTEENKIGDYPIVVAERLAIREAIVMVFLTNL